MLDFVIVSYYSSSMKHIIFDGSNVIWRAHWVGSRHMSSQEHSYQDAHIFLQIIHGICSGMNCYNVYIAWDDRELRQELNPRRAQLQQYKQNRSNDASVYVNVDLIKKLASSLGMVHVRPYALEGDDVISILCEELQGDKIIVSADQDLAQLVSSQVSFYSLTKKILITESNFTEYFPVSPDKFLTYKCIIGDNSDNIPGVPSYGPKRARKLAEQYHQDQNIIDSGIKDIIERNRIVMDLKHFITDAEREYIQQQLSPDKKQVDSGAFRSLCKQHNLNKMSELNILSYMLS